MASRFAAALLIAGLMGACAGTGPTSGADTAPPATTAPTATSETPATEPATTAPEETESATSVDLDATIFDSGFLVHVNEAAVDDDGATIRINADFESQSLSDATIDTIGATLEWQGQSVAVLPSGQTTVSPDDSITADLRGRAPDGFRLEESTLVFGSADQHQSTVALTPGGEVSTQLPREFDVSGRAELDDLLTVEITDGVIVPATCDGSPGSFVLLPAPKDEESILLTATFESLDNPNGTNPESTLTTPQGPSTEHDPVALLLDAGEALDDLVVCYTVTAPASGHYASTWTARRDATDPFVDGTIEFDIEAP